MPFPTTARYFVSFRNSDTGLSPQFSFFKRTDTLANVAAPNNVPEVEGGTYYFDWTWNTPADPDLVFEVDAGPSIPTEEVRYVKGLISPRDRFIDEPSSEIIAQIKGGDNRDLSQIAGTGFSTSTDSLKVISDNIDTVATQVSGVASATAAAVWNRLLNDHQTVGTMGRTLNDVFRTLKNKAIINTTTKQLEVYDDAGLNVILVFDLRDENGVASATSIFQRIPP